jgi:hypothetical protein
MTRVVEASVEKPYLGLRLNLDPALVTSTIVESGIETRTGDAGAKVMDVKKVNANLLDAVARLVQLLDNPGDLKVLAPIIIQEVI